MIKNSAKEALKEGSILNGKNFRYKIIKVLGLGSFGITYLADIINENGQKTNMRVALKELFIAECNDRHGDKVGVFSRPEIFEEFIQKFTREAENLHQIQHSNIINVYEWFNANDTVYYSMSYIEGGSLKEVLDNRGKLRPEEALETAQVIANALDELHSLGLLHLDVRPQNIMMNGGKVPVLIDFGLAKHFNEEGEPDTSIGLGNGTAGYAPMEQASYQPGNGIPRSIDVYSLGATLYKMVTGDEPPTASEIFNYGFPCEELERAGIDKNIIDVIEKSMQPLWKDRYATASHQEKAIAKALSGIENGSKKSVSDNTKQTIPYSSMERNDTREERTQISTEVSTKYTPDEATRVESEVTQVNYSLAASSNGYTPDESTRIEPSGVLSGIPVAPPPIPTKGKNRTAAYILIGTVVAFIAILIGTDIYTGWIRELFRTPVECVVLEGDESESDIEVKQTQKR
ncbi:MAG: serine/threonine protein kinase [Prevotella sp.]|nr:serine/threonine protein kinase [Bacteroides sp.]MCM1366431.1 serine/threonine protein kinase [Prevotella sp.]